MSEIPSLYDWAGGAAALDRLTGVFYAKVAEDETLGPVFAQMNSRHPHYVAVFLAEVLGGPAGYTAERGGHAQMISAHLNRHLTESQRRRWTALIQDAADEAGLPDDPEFRSAFLAYIEWGTRLAVINSQAGAQVLLDQPMPRWGWGEPGGPYTEAD